MYIYIYIYIYIFIINKPEGNAVTADTANTSIIT